MNKAAAFDYIELKSFEIRLIILPIYWDFAVYWEILDSFLYIKNISRPLTLLSKYGL